MKNQIMNGVRDLPWGGESNTENSRQKAQESQKRISFLVPFVLLRGNSGGQRDGSLRWDIMTLYEPRFWPEKQGQIGSLCPSRLVRRSRCGEGGSKSVKVNQTDMHQLKLS
jgi:hypothetical protein